MSRANPFWGAARLHGELQKLEINISQATVAKYMVRHRKPPSQKWRTFLENHVKELVSIDFLVVPTVSFRILFVFVVRPMTDAVQFILTSRPTCRMERTANRRSIPWDSAPRHLLRDEMRFMEKRFGSEFWRWGIHEVLTTPRSPWQNPYVERLLDQSARVPGPHDCA
jgi:hypothetical protein